MADWLMPQLTSHYADFLALVKERDFDAASQFVNPTTNHPPGVIRYVRSSNKFQEWDGVNWIDKVISISGGGTGAQNPGDARTNLGIGSMGIQNSSAVVITGGVISGLNSLGVNGNASIGGVLITGYTPVTLTHPNGKINAINSTYFQSLAFDAVNLVGGPYPGLNGNAITNLDAAKITTNLVNVNRLGTGAGGGKFLRDDNTWQEASVVRSVQAMTINSPWIPHTTATRDFNIPIPLADYTKCTVTQTGASQGAQTGVFYLINNSQIRWQRDLAIDITTTERFFYQVYIVEYKNVG